MRITHRRLASAVVLVIGTALLAGCKAYTLVDNKPVTVKDGCSIEPQMRWSKATMSKFGNSSRTEVWTADGERLDMVAFFCGIRDGEPLFSAQATSSEGLSTKQQEEPFIFRKGMAPNEIMDMFEAGLGKATQSAIVRTRDLRPSKLGDADGFRFEVSYVQKDDVDREGTVVGAIKNDKLYLVFYQGTRLFYYGKYLPTVESIVRTAQLKS